MPLSVTHERNSAIAVMHDMCDIPWDAASFIADHLTEQWFNAPCMSVIIKFRRVARTQAIEILQPSDAPNGTVVDRATGAIFTPATTRELVMS